jgi:hypothetical protein
MDSSTSAIASRPNSAPMGRALPRRRERARREVDPPRPRRARSGEPSAHGDEPALATELDRDHPGLAGEDVARPPDRGGGECRALDHDLGEHRPGGGRAQPSRRLAGRATVVRQHLGSASGARDPRGQRAVRRGADADDVNARGCRQPL